MVPKTVSSPAMMRFSLANKTMAAASLYTAPSCVRPREAGGLALVGLALYLTIGPVSADFPPSIEREPRRGIFLVADRSLADPNFSRTVVLLTYHGITGSIGLIINKSSSVGMISILPELEGLADPQAKLRFGGPLELHSVRLLVSSASEIQNAEQLFKDVYFVNSTTTLQSLLTNKASKPGSIINYYAGYAGWNSGQLPAEIARGDWHLIKADAATIFERDNVTIWDEFIEKLEGIWVLMENGVAADH